MSAQITFVRGGGWSDRMRKYQVFVNDRQVAHLRRNSQEVVAIPSGQHQLCAKVDWCSSAILTLDLNDGDQIEILVENPHGPWRGQFVISSAPQTYLALNVTKHITGSGTTP